jgi:hypothetical protein
MSAQTEAFWNKHTGIITLVLGLVAIIAGAIIAFLIYRLQKRIKTFDWEIVANQEIPAETAGGPEGLVVTWKGETLVRPRLVNIRLANTGNVEILKGEFQDAIRIGFVGSIAKTSAIIGNSNPAIEFPTCDTIDGEVYVGAALYNKKDWVDLQILLDDGLQPVVESEVEKKMLQEQFGTEGGSSYVKLVVAGEERPSRQIVRQDVTFSATLTVADNRVSHAIKQLATVAAATAVASLGSALYTLFK